MSPTDIYEKYKGAVVLVRTYDYWGTLVSYGSGFNIEQTGTIVTNYHLIADAFKITVDFGNKHEYKVEGFKDYDKQADLIILNINTAGSELPTIPLGNSTKVKVGDEVYVIGNPLGVFEKTFSSGVISQVLESREIGFSKTIFQLTVPVLPGSSGSPVLNNKGEAIAIIMASVPFKYEAQNINFASPVNYIRPFLASTIVHELKAPKIYEKIMRLKSEANLYSMNEEYIEAINLYTEIIKLDPKNKFGLTADAYADRSYQYTLLGLNEKAFDDISKALELEPDNANFYNDRGCTLQDMGRHEDAIADFTIAIKLNPEYVLPYGNRGNAYYNLGLFEKAIIDYTKYIEMRLDTINKRYSQDDFLYELGMLSKTARICYFRGMSYWKLGQINKAVEDFKKALELDPDFEHAREALKALRVSGY